MVSLLASVTANSRHAEKHGGADIVVVVDSSGIENDEDNEQRRIQNLMVSNLSSKMPARLIELPSSHSILLLKVFNLTRMSEFKQDFVYSLVDQIAVVEGKRKLLPAIDMSFPF
jgi:hypothetical protein